MPRLWSGSVRTVVLTVSTSVARREADDASGPLLARLVEEAGAEVVAMEVVPDDFALIEDRLHHYADAGVRFIFTTGGTGLTPDDVTPEATRAVIERDAPGIAEAMRAESLRHTPMGDPLARRVGPARRDADRQLPRQPEGDRAALRPAGAGARARRAIDGPARWPRRRPLSCAA